MIICGQFVPKKKKNIRVDQNHRDYIMIVFTLLELYILPLSLCMLFLGLPLKWYKIKYLRTYAPAMKHLNVIKINFTSAIPS